MTLEINSEKQPVGETPSPSRSGEVRGEPVTPSGYRDAYRNARGQLTSDLNRCVEEAMYLGVLLRAYVAVSLFPQTFRFQDAMSYVPAPETDESLAVVEKFKSTLSRQIKARANKADECETLEAKALFLREVEQVFIVKSQDVIDDTRSRCGQLTEELCARLNSVVSTLEQEFHGKFDQQVEVLKVRSASLFRYSSLYLSASPKEGEEATATPAIPSTIELISGNANGPVLLVSVEDFFERLKSTAFDLQHDLNEQSAA